MGGDRFDTMTRAAGDRAATRRTVARLLAAGAASAFAARLALPTALAKPAAADGRAASRHRKQPGPPETQSAGTRPDDRPSRKGKGRGHHKRCSEVVPLCPPCHDPRCDQRTQTWSCVAACPVGFGCCNGQCEPPCDNGCDYNPAEACACETPPAGTSYCPSLGQCHATCPTCPSGAHACPDYGYGNAFDLPPDCCPDSHYYYDTSICRFACAIPVSDAGAVRCE